MPTTHAPSVWDISAPVHRASPVYPGDAPYQQRWSASMAEGSVVNLSTLSLSPHVGTHADAPLHYDAQGAAAGALDLAPYLGPCRVVHAIGCGPQVQWQHLAHAITPDLPPRLLVRTYRQAPQDWDPQLSGIAPEVLARLPLLQQSTRPYGWQQWVQSVGVDAPRALDGPRYELFSMLAVAASHGLGVALIPPMLVEAELARGELVVACAQPLRGERSYYLVTPNGTPAPALGLFSAWLSEMAAQQT